MLVYKMAAILLWAKFSHSCTMLCYIVLCFAMLCNVVLCSATLHFVVLFCAMLP